MYSYYLTHWTTWVVSLAYNNYYAKLDNYVHFSSSECMHNYDEHY